MNTAASTGELQEEDRQVTQAVRYGRHCECRECRWFSWLDKVKWKALVTLTFRQRGGSLPGKQRSAKAIERFLAIANYYQGTPLFAVEERGERTGRLHWHVIVKAEGDWANQALGAAVLDWEQREGFTHFKNVDNPAAYVLKYLLKDDLADWRASMMAP